jgi:hypothetical protein
MTDAYKRLAEDDGAHFCRGSESDRWTAADRDGMVVVSDAMSVAEAARLYCEDRGLVSPEEILDRIVAAYRPYHVLDEFWQGFKAHQRNSVFRCNPYRAAEGVKSKAWDRGANVAMQYKRALAHRGTTPDEADEVEPAWVVRLLRMGRC